MVCTWEKFSSLPAKKKTQKFETATRKENGVSHWWEIIVRKEILDTRLSTHMLLKDMILIAI